MFTAGAICLVIAVIWYSDRMNQRDRLSYGEPPDGESLRLHIRQDLKLVVFLLAGILVALGVIADRIG